MGILTNFLKLLKPEENDYYNAITEQAENWQKVDNWAKRIDDSNKNKLDKGNVSAEYDTAKKIEDKIKEVKDTADEKVSKSGDTMTGSLTSTRFIINSPSISQNAPQFQLRENKVLLGMVSVSPIGVALENTKSNTMVLLKNDGTVTINDKQLPTFAKDLSSAIAENNKILVANSGLPYDINLRYLNDNGTKQQGYFYLDKNKKGLFKCIKTTASTVNSVEFFEDISNNALSIKGTPKIIFNGAVSQGQTITVEDMSKFSLIIVRGRFAGAGSIFSGKDISIGAKVQAFGIGTTIDTTSSILLRIKSNTTIYIERIFQGTSMDEYNQLSILGIY